MRNELRLLGKCELTGADGQLLLPVLAQPKRFALLVYLLLSRPPRLHQRDELLALFWPELDEEHARGALSQSLTFLRRFLGEGVVIAHGTDLVGVEADRFECDVLRFEAAANADQHARAAEIYLGAFLEAFHVTDCELFEHWLEGERRRLHERALRSTRISAKDANDSDGVVAAQRAAELAPYDEAPIRQLMISLACAGRRGRALEEYRSFVTRLADDLALEPSAELHALSASIRKGAFPSASGRPEQPPGDQERAASRSTDAHHAPAPLALASEFTPGPGGRPFYFYRYTALMFVVTGAALVTVDVFDLPDIVDALLVLVAALCAPLVLRSPRSTRARSLPPR